MSEMVTGQIETCKVRLVVIFVSDELAETVENPN